MIPALLLVAPARLVHLGAVDIVIIAFYFALVLGIGFYLKRQANTGEDFFMAGREMTAWIAGLAFLSANLGALELMGWAGSAYQYGILAMHWYWIGAIPAMLFLALVMMPFYYISKTHSVPGYLKLRFGEPARAVSAVSFAFMTVLMSGVNMYAMAKVLQIVLGWNIHFSIWVASITVAIYVVLGGLRSAIFNEVLQFVLIWAGAMLVPILGLVEAGGWTNLKAQIAHNASAEYTHLWSTLGNFNNNPMGINWVGIVFGLCCVISAGYWTTDFLVVQRVLAAKDLRSAKLAPIIGAAFKMAVPFIVILPGLLGLAVLRDPATGLMIKLVPESVATTAAGIAQGLHSYNDVLPLMLARYCGPGLLGLGMTALIAGFMSGMAGNVTAFSTVWTYDIYRAVIRKDATDHHYLNMGRWSTVLGVYADEKGRAFREKYKKRFPGIMGLVYTGNGYDIVMYLKKAWEAVGDPSNFKAVCDWVRANPDRGVCGFMDMRNEYQEAKHFPDNGFGNQSAELEKGMSQLYVQVQNVEHKIIFPNEIAESKLQPAPWWS